MNETIDSELGSQGSGFSTSLKNSLHTAAKWSGFLSILGYIGAGFTLLAGFGIMLFGGTISDFGGEMPVNPGVFGVVYIVIAVLYLIPTMRMHNFSKLIKKHLANGSDTDFENGIRNLAGMFQFIGIFTIVMIVLYILMIFVGLSFGAFL